MTSAAAEHRAVVKVLKEFHDDFQRSSMEPRTVLGTLYARDFISAEESEKIQSPTNKEERLIRLLRTMSTKNKLAMSAMIDALRANGQGTVAARMERRLAELLNRSEY